MYLKHGHTSEKEVSKTYKIWAGMNKRCKSSNDSAFKNYGKRKIKVCYRWSSRNKNGYANFLKDMGERPLGLTLDRIDNNLGYHKQNCRWATYKQQNRNMRTNINVSLNGKLVCLKDYCKIKNLNYSTIMTRKNRGWSIKRALTTPVKTHKKENK